MFKYSQGQKAQKFTLEEAKSLPILFLMRLIRKMKAHIKKDETLIKKFEEYDVPIDEIDYIPMKFGDIEVSGKTDHGLIIFNYKLLCDGDFLKDYSYAIHEVTHYLQQTCGESGTKPSNDGDYLDNPYEIEGFQTQLEYIADQHGEQEAEDYVDHLLDHHEIDDKKEKNDKKEELLAEI